MHPLSRTFVKTTWKQRE